MDLTFNKRSNREELLGAMKRYHEMQVMFYRTNNLIHSRRVFAHLSAAMPDIISSLKGFDFEKARVMTLIHDDLETITQEDISSYRKEHLTPEEKKALSDYEKSCIPVAVERYGEKVNGFDYGELLREAYSKSTLESQMVSFFDKFDAAGEAWHEVWAGNPEFLRPSTLYPQRIGLMVRQFGGLLPFFNRISEYFPFQFNFKESLKSGIPHTPSSVVGNSGYLPYDVWRSNVYNSEGLRNLTIPVEFTAQITK